MSSADITYLNLLYEILEHGSDRSDRTGTGTRSIFGLQAKYSLRDSLPILTTKRIHMKSVVHELLWFIAGDTNIKYLNDHGVSIWDEWADSKGDLGPVYGKQWRSWDTPDGRKVDQLLEVIHQLKTNPMSRRHIVCAWNPGEVEAMALPPCHLLFQFYVGGTPEAPTLSCQLYQRSADMFLGVPFNIASYALLTCMIAHVCGMQPDTFVHTIGDAHIYHNHLDQVKEQIGRTPREAPTLRLNACCTHILDFGYDDIRVEGYNPHPPIKAPIAV